MLAVARCSSQRPAGAGVGVLKVHTLWSGTLEHPSCTEATLVLDGRCTGGKQGSAKIGGNIRGLN